MIRSETTKRKVKASFDDANQKAAGQFTGEQRHTYQDLRLEGIIEAPVNIAVFYVPEAGPVLGQHSMPRTGLFSVVCAIQNMWLMSRALNVGLGWISILEPEKVKQALAAPPACDLVGYLCLGYVDEFLDSPELEQKGWAARKAVNDVVFSEMFPDH